MATVTACPKCSEKLRLPDDLLGQRVRCPQCTTIFEAVDPSKAPPAPPPGVDVPLKLSLDDSTPQAVAARSKPVGAVDMNLSLDDDAPKTAAAPAPQPAPPSPPPSERPRDRDTNGERETDRDGNDTTSCPVCRRSNQRDARRRYQCGERLAGGRSRTGYPDRDTYDDDYPSRVRRRDTEPHRSGVVLAMGIVSLVSLLVIPAIGIPFGIIGWIMGHIDLRKMKAGQMDPDGESMTRGGWICSIIGTIINSLYMLSCVGFILFIVLGEQNRPRTTKSWSPPPVQQKMNKDIGAPPAPEKAKDAVNPQPK